MATAKWLATQLQLDQALTYALASRIWQAVSGPITIVLIIRYMAGAEQGAYYGLVGISSLQAFFELGLLSTVVTFTGHEASKLNHLTTKEPGEFEPAEEKAISRVHSLCVAASRWFQLAAAAFLLFALIFGWQTMQQSDTQIAWQAPLLLMLLFAAISVAISPRIAVLEGLGYRTEVYRLRFLQAFAGSVVVWVTLITGGSLWSIVAAATVQTLAMLYFAHIKYRQVFIHLRQRSSMHDSFSWRREVLPIQWRLAMMGAVYHFATQLFAVIVIRYHGNMQAGQIGMTLSITLALQLLAAAWVQTKLPLIAQLHGEGNREDAGTMWRRTAVVSSSLLIAGLTLLTVTVGCLPMLNLGLETRFITPQQLALLSVGCLGCHLTAVVQFYVLSRQANPLIVASITGFGITGIAVWLCGYHWSVGGIAWSFAITMTTVTVPLHLWAYWRFRGDVESRNLSV